MKDFDMQGLVYGSGLCVPSALLGFGRYYVPSTDMVVYLWMWEKVVSGILSTDGSISSEARISGTMAL